MKIFKTLHRPGWWRILNGTALFLALNLFFPPLLIAQMVAAAEPAMQAAQRARPLAVDIDTGRLDLALLDAVMFRGADITGVGRFWHAGAAAHGLGNGWRLSCDEQVQVNHDGSATILGIEGLTEFNPAGDGQWTTKIGYLSTLQRTPDGGFLWQAPGLEQRHYNAQGWLVSLATPTGGYSVMRDPQGLAQTVTDGGGNQIQTVIANNHYAAVKDALGNLWSYNYNPNGNLSAVTRPAGGRENYQYDAQNRLSSADIGFGKINMERDDNGRVTAQTYGELTLGKWAYSQADENWIAIEELTPGQHVTYTRNADRRHLEYTNAQGDKIQAVLDARLQVIEASENGRTIFHGETDEHGRYLVLRDNEQDLTLSYGQNGMLERLINSQNIEIHQEYDDAGRLIAMRGSDGGRAEWSWNKAGQCTRIQVKDPVLAALEVKLTYNDRGHLQNIATDARQVSYQTDPLGRVVELTSGEEKVGIAYDAESFPVSVSENGQPAFTAQYDSRGLPVNLAGKAGNVSFKQQLDGRLAAISGVNGGVTQFKYDGLGRLRGIVNPGDGEFTFAYDTRGRVIGTTIPGGAALNVAYNDADRPASIELPGGKINLQYDDDGRLVRQDGGKLGNVTFDYDLIAGTLRGWTDSTGETVRRQDDEVLYEQTNIPCTVVTAVKRDGTGTVQSVRVKSEDIFRRCYDDAGRLVRIEGAAGVFRLEHDQDGRRTALAYPNGARTIYSYDDKGWLQTLTHLAPDGGIWQSWRYTFDDNGRVAGLVDQGGNQRHYEYTTGGELAQVKDGKGALLESFSWDRNGNLRQALVDGIPTEFVYDDKGTLVKAGNTTFTHDQFGRRTQHRVEGAAAAINFEYDSLSRLTGITAADKAIAEFGYALQGNRLWRTDQNGTKRYYLYSGPDVVAETDANGKVLSTMVLGADLDELLAVRDGSGEWRYHQRDPLQSLHAVSNAAGQKLADYAYTAFGIPVKGEADLAHNILFAGRDWLEGAGIYDNRARCYDPATGRFLTLDPVGVYGGLNPYGYCGGNPLAYRDPSGKILPIIIIGVLVGGGVDALVQVATNKEGEPINWRNVGLSAIFGGATAGLGAVFTGIKAVVVIGTSSGALKTVVQNLLDGKPFDLVATVIDGVLGGLTAGLCDKFLNPALRKAALRSFWDAVKSRWGYVGVKHALNAFLATAGGVVDGIVGAIKNILTRGGPGDAITDLIKQLGPLGTGPLGPIYGVPGMPGTIRVWVENWINDGLGGGFGGGGLPGAGSGKGRGKPPVKLDKFR